MREGERERIFNEDFFSSAIFSEKRKRIFHPLCVAVLKRRACVCMHGMRVYVSFVVGRVDLFLLLCFDILF